MAFDSFLKNIQRTFQGVTGGGVHDDGDRPMSSFPIGIEVTHHPDPVRARRGGRSGSPFTWQFATSVRTLHEPLAVIQFGAMVLCSGEWVPRTYTGKPFTPNDFAEWYSCPGATLIPGQTYTDPCNWYGSNQLRIAHRTKWYYIAQTAQGKQVRGEAEITSLPELETTGKTGR